MAQFIPAVLTDLGITLSADILTGEQLEFTKIVTGAGEYAEDELIRSSMQKITDLRDKRQEFKFGSIGKAAEHCVLLKSVITNIDLAEGYRMTEIGIYAKKKGEEGEGILYSLSVATEADYFPQYNGAYSVDIIDEHYITVSDTASVTIQVDSTSTVMLEDFLKFRDEIYQELNKYKIVLEVDLTELERRVEECFQSVSNGKALIASALTDKGVETEATATFATMRDNINMLDYTVATAIADNISLDKTAWVNGEKITGNGADVNAAYNQGYSDGYESVQTNAKIEYTYHVHSGNPTTKGGCYTVPVYHVHTSGCYSGSICTCGGFKGNHNIEKGCERCGHHYDWHWASGYDGPCGHNDTVLVCGKNTSTIEGYSLGCGKTESTIESAIITFD